MRTTIPSREIRIPSDLRIQAAMGPFSTSVGDHEGTAWCCTRLLFLTFFSPSRVLFAGCWLLDEAASQSCYYALSLLYSFCTTFIRHKYGRLVRTGCRCDSLFIARLLRVLRIVWCVVYCVCCVLCFVCFVCCVCGVCCVAFAVWRLLASAGWLWLFVQNKHTLTASIPSPPLPPLPPLCPPSPFPSLCPSSASPSLLCPTSPPS